MEEERLANGWPWPPVPFPDAGERTDGQVAVRASLDGLTPFQAERLRGVLQGFLLRHGEGTPRPVAVVALRDGEGDSGNMDAARLCELAGMPVRLLRGCPSAALRSQALLRRVVVMPSIPEGVLGWRKDEAWRLWLLAREMRERGWERARGQGYRRPADAAALALLPQGGALREEWRTNGRPRFPPPDPPRGWDSPRPRTPHVFPDIPVAGQAEEL